jgi:hypothetical protein
MATIYLTNRDLMREINRSKATYSVFADKSYHVFDSIVKDLNDIDDERIAEARQTYVDRMKKENSVVVDPATVPKTALIFRLMSWQHIPEVEPKVSKPKSKKAELIEILDIPEEEAADLAKIVPLDQPTTYAKVNFPPFQHWKFDDTDTLVCVGKSHWRGALDGGEFCTDHGTITNNLALMFIKLTDRYGTRANWRNYTYNDEMRCQALMHLSAIALKFDESRSSNPFAYFTQILKNSFLRVLSVEKKHQTIRDDILEMNSLTPSFTRQGEWGSGHSSHDE